MGNRLGNGSDAIQTKTRQKKAAVKEYLGFASENRGIAPTLLSTKSSTSFYNRPAPGAVSYEHNGGASKVKPGSDLQQGANSHLSLCGTTHTPENLAPA